MGRKVKWGIISTGNVVRNRFMPGVLETTNSEVVAVGSRTPRRAQAFAQEFNIPAHHGSYEGLIDDPNVEAIYVGTVNDDHAEWTARAAGAGKHVLCEKPLGVDADEALRMIEHCETRGVLLMEGFMYRFNPRALKIKEVIESGLIGEVRSLVAQFSFTIDPPRYSRLLPGKGAGSLMDVGCYCINISRYYFGEEPHAVVAAQRFSKEYGCDMLTSAILEFSRRRTAVICCSFETGYRSSVEIAGSAGTLRALEKFINPPDKGKIGFSVDTIDGQTHKFEVDAVNQFQREIEHFSDCVLTGRKPMLDPRVDALGNALVIDAIRRSARERAWVEVPAPS